MSDEDRARGVAEPPPGEDDFDPDAPREGSRISPYGIAALVLAMFGLSEVRGAVFMATGGTLFADEALTYIAASVIPVLPAAVALWFVELGQDEISGSEGRLRGWDLCRAARGVAIATMSLIALSIIFSAWQAISNR